MSTGLPLVLTVSKPQVAGEQAFAFLVSMLVLASERAIICRSLLSGRNSASSPRAVTSMSYM